VWLRVGFKATYGIQELAHVNAKILEGTSRLYPLALPGPLLYDRAMGIRSALTVFAPRTMHWGATMHWGVLCASVLYATPSLAGSLADDGTLVFDSQAVLKDSLDKTPAGAPQGITVGTREPLEGDGYIVVATSQQLARIPLTLPKENGSYVARAWARKNRLVGSIQVTRAAGSGRGEFAQFYPTGRVTSDGWYEIATSPFSVASGAAVDWVLFGSGVDVDALELVRQGSFRPETACSGKGDAQCNASEYCSAGFCRNGDAQVPPLPQGELRTNTIRYLSERLEFAFGGRITRRDTLPRALSRLASLSSAKSGFEFWNGVSTAIHELRDWHTKMSGPVGTEGRGALPICVVEGDADLSRDLAPSTPGLPDVIVSHVGPEQNSGLKPGDRIVQVNGVHPIAFAESLFDIDWAYWHASDPDVHAEALERLRYLIRRWGKNLTVIRCTPAVGGGVSTCQPPETLSIADLPKTEPNLYPECDHRPTYAIPGPDASTHQVSGIQIAPLSAAAPSEQLYGMVWNSVYLQGTDNPYAPAYDTLRQNARGVLLDHRTGNGGTEPAAEFLTSLFRPLSTLGIATGFHLSIGFLDNFPAASGQRLFELGKTGREAYNVGSTTARTDIKAALLLARDGSASDWFPEGMKNTPNVRSFGRRTAGAFSSFLQFDYYGGLSFQIASGDYIRENGTTHLGEGVAPDEEILPKQSDLLVGRDTAVERALAWLRETP
jgi:hypothetical protein